MAKIIKKKKKKGHCAECNDGGSVPDTIQFGDADISDDEFPCIEVKCYYCQVKLGYFALKSMKGITLRASGMKERAHEQRTKAS